MLIKCEICGKQAEIPKKNVSFYAQWLEITPEKFIYRECEKSALWPNIIQYKLPGLYQTFKKIADKDKPES